MKIEKTNNIYPFNSNANFVEFAGCHDSPGVLVDHLDSPKGPEELTTISLYLESTKCKDFNIYKIV